MEKNLKTGNENHDKCGEHVQLGNKIPLKFCEKVGKNGHNHRI